MFDLELIKEMGFCRGIENYSRHLTGKKQGEPPPTLLDYLPRDTMMVIDESHQSIPRFEACLKEINLANAPWLSMASVCLSTR